ncbi:MAG: N-acetylneuraminate synthase [Chloroflexi bacterium]|nr:N-acetylneuraminate synthase [Chloroflexota bacterium]
MQRLSVSLTPERTVTDYGEPFIIAEIGANHNGDVAFAKELIRLAKESGADAVKFQTWTKTGLFAREVYADNPDLEAQIDQYALSFDDFAELKAYADEVGILWAATPFTEAEVDFLVHDLNVPFIKVASMDLNNYPFLAYIAAKGKPMIVSTGLSTLAEIDQAVQVIEETGNRQLVLLHCVSLYPPRDEQVHLRQMDTLRAVYPYPIGFSDHTVGVSIPLAAVARGAAVVEKHFTKDKTLPGWDHAISADPEEMAFLTREARRVWRALGDPRIVPPEDEAKKQAFRRSIVTARPIPKGTVITREMLTFKRPGTGFPPAALPYIVGRRAARDIPADVVLREEDLL